MLCLSRSILLLLCLTILFASSVGAQEKQNVKSFPCGNQAEVEFIGFEIITGAVESLNVETEAIVPEGDFLLTNKGKPFLFATYKYDRRGRLIEKNFYRSDGVALPKTTFDYDAENKLIKENHFSAVSGKPYLETKYVYEAGVLKEIIGSNIEDNKFLSKKVFTYDSAKNYFEFTKTVSYTERKTRVGFTQDAKCRISEVFAYQPDGKLAAKVLVNFDDKNNPDSAVVYAADNSVLAKRKMEYEFDARGNWIKKSDYSWGKENDKFDWKLMNIAYRKIKYFDTK